MHLYLHIPFCRQACYYCDFHFSTNTTVQSEMVQAMVRELALQQNYLPGPELQTVYFGGGTPSLLTEAELEALLGAVGRYYTLSDEVEISLEANPDDLDTEKIKLLKRAGVNRLSIGIQSFHDPHLKMLNRLHSGKEAEEVVKKAQDAGITNISADLIYAIPSPDHGILEQDLERITDLNIPHLSAYCLTIEPRTVFHKRVKDKQMAPVEDRYAAEQFEYVVTGLAGKGYEQYEISNFAKEQQYSRHNTAYWQRKPYLGIGPSAHSYSDTSRQYNVANNAQYLKALAAGTVPATREALTTADQVNEYLLTGLRTKWGCRWEVLDQLSGGEFREYSRSILKEHAGRGWIHLLEDKLLLTESGKLFADRIASDLFLV